MNKDDLIRTVAEVSKLAGASANQKSAYAELLIELLEPQHLTLDLFSTFMPSRSAQEGDVVVKRVRRGRYAVQSMVPGTNHLTNQPTQVHDYHSYVYDRLISGVRESLWNVQGGGVQTVQDLRRQLQLDITDTLVTKVFNLLGTVWNSVDTPTHYVETSTLTNTVVEELIENVMDTAGNVRAIMGTRRALRPMYEFAGFREYAYTDGSGLIAYPVNEKQMENQNTNRITAFKGVPVIELPQVFRNQLPNLRERLIPDDKILVIGENAGEIILYGDMRYQDYTDNTIQPPDYVLHAYQSYGMVVDMPENIGVIQLT